MTQRRENVKFHIPNNDNFQTEYIKCAIKNDSLVFQIKVLFIMINLITENNEYDHDFIKESSQELYCLFILFIRSFALFLIKAMIWISISICRIKGQIIIFI